MDFFATEFERLFEFSSETIPKVIKTLKILINPFFSLY